MTTSLLELPLALADMQFREQIRGQADGLPGPPEDEYVGLVLLLAFFRTRWFLSYLTKPCLAMTEI